MPDEVGHATDVDVNRGEGRGDGCLGGGEGDPGVGSLQGTTVVAPVAAHDGLPPLIIDYFIQEVPQHSHWFTLLFHKRMLHTADGGQRSEW